MKKYKRCLFPLLIGTALSVSMGLMLWVGFFFVFIPIGLSVSKSSINRMYSLQKICPAKAIA
jgi:hypothetical protein